MGHSDMEFNRFFCIIHIDLSFTSYSAFSCLLFLVLSVLANKKCIAYIPRIRALGVKGTFVQSFVPRYFVPQTATF
jgi:hypothetical protein